MKGPRSEKGGAVERALRSRLVDVGVAHQVADRWSALQREADGSGNPRAGTQLALLSLVEGIIETLPVREARSDAEQRVITDLRRAARRVRRAFLRHHAAAVYAELTAGTARGMRLTPLTETAAARFPGLIPTTEQLAADARRTLREKEGVETDLALFLSHLLADSVAGSHLLEVMRTPHPGTEELLSEFRLTGTAQLPHALAKRVGAITTVQLANPAYLNAEDASTLESLEIAVDLALLDDQTCVCVLRGAVVNHPKYSGGRVFSSGLNLTRLYQGEVPYLFFLERELGLVSKIQRGLLGTDSGPPARESGYRSSFDAGQVFEKPWVAAVDKFAIGGGLQLLLVVDWVVAERDALLSLPAMAEGLIPGAANLRLGRFLDHRLARRMVTTNQSLRAGTPPADQLCDEVAPRGELEAAIDRAAAALLTAGGQSAVSNRRAFRVGMEPDEAFRQYMATYAWEQARCLFSPALRERLEAVWPPAARLARATTHEPSGTRAGMRGLASSVPGGSES